MNRGENLQFQMVSLRSPTNTLRLSNSNDNSIQFFPQKTEEEGTLPSSLILTLRPDTPRRKTTPAHRHRCRKTNPDLHLRPHPQVNSN